MTHDNIAEMHGVYSTLRKKWGTVPLTETNRIDSKDIIDLPDATILAIWEQGYRTTSLGPAYGVRGWYHDLYRHQLNGRKVLDVGCGLGISSIHFAEHGAQLTFADIVEDNLDFVRRVCELKGLEANYLLIESHESFDRIDRDYDVVMAMGSLINAPIEFTRQEIQAILPHLRDGGRWLHFAYPKSRLGP